MTPDSPRRAAAPTPAAGGEHIRPEWVEAAAEALARARVEAAWRDMGSLTRAAYRLLARATLPAVVPAIQAQALRDAAAVLVPRAEDNPLLAGLIRINGGAQAAFTYAVETLTERADRVERGELP